MNRIVDETRYAPSEVGGVSEFGGRRRQVAVAMHQNSSQLQDCLNPVRGIRDQQRRHGIIPVNHARNNAAAVRQRSLVNRELKQEEEERAAMEAETRRSPAAASGGKSSGYGSASYVPNRPSSAEGKDGRPTSAGKTPSTPSGGSPHAKPFVGAAPISKTCSERVPSQKKDAEQYLKKKEYGRVPRYLLNIQLQLAEQHAQRQAEKEASLVPSGMRILPEDERIDMLEVLAHSRDEVEAEIRALPFVLETPSQLRHKHGLEKRIEEIDTAITIFSRPRVLVQIEDPDLQHEEQ